MNLFRDKMKKVFLIILCLITTFSPTGFLYAHESVKPLRILIVPGHDNEFWGAQYGTIKEADMNLVLATAIYNTLKKDKRFKVYITRDSKGYVKEFADYFSLHSEDIIAFKEKAKKETLESIAGGSFIKKDNVIHNPVNKDVSVRLYGINKWANDNKMDAVIHVHFNDYPRASVWTIGDLKGFAIYIPEEQMVNSKESVKLAENVFSQLKKKYTTSTYIKESSGLVPDQELIALGANGTLSSDVRSILIEYGYIYEKKFRKTSTRRQAYKDMAARTVSGLKNYFFPK